MSREGLVIGVADGPGRGKRAGERSGPVAGQEAQGSVSHAHFRPTSPDRAVAGAAGSTRPYRTSLHYRSSLPTNGSAGPPTSFGVNFGLHAVSPVPSVPPTARIPHIPPHKE